jgi:hypothetical protein
MDIPALKHGSTRWNNQSGQILAEACIGLALLVFVWILISFVAYLSNNRIRTAMAARDAAWLQAKGLSTASVPSAFFYGDDVQLAKVMPAQQVSLSMPAVVQGIILAQGGGLDSMAYGMQDNYASDATVTFGMTASEVKSTTTFPFNLLNVQVPFMADLDMDNFLSVTSSCAWPGEDGADPTWSKARDVARTPLSAALILAVTIQDLSTYPIPALAVAAYLAAN